MGRESEYSMSLMSQQCHWVNFNDRHHSLGPSGEFIYIAQLQDFCHKSKKMTGKSLARHAFRLQSNFSSNLSLIRYLFSNH